MRLLIVDKTAGLQSSDERHRAIAALPGIDLHVAGPRRWIEAGRQVDWHPEDDLPYTAHVCRMAAQGHYARAFYVSGLRRALRRAKPDVIQLLEEPWALSSGQVSLLAGGTPQVFYTWENIYRDFVYPSRLSLLYARIDRRLHRQAVGAICATHGALDVLKKKGFENPTAVIPYGIPGYFFENPKSPTADTERFTIGYIGRLMAMKGVGHLLRAAQRILGSDVLMVGSGVGEATLRQLIVALCMEDCTRIVPPVAETKIPGYLRQMDVLVLPSETTSGWKEQLGRVLIEAMAAGVPVIGSNSGAIPEVIGDAGLVFREADVEDLSAKLKQVRADHGLRGELAAQGRARARERFTWDRFARDLREFYVSLGWLES